MGTTSPFLEAQPFLGLFSVLSLGDCSQKLSFSPDYEETDSPLFSLAPTSTGGHGCGSHWDTFLLSFFSVSRWSLRLSHLRGEGVQMSDSGLLYAYEVSPAPDQQHPTAGAGRRLIPDHFPSLMLIWPTGEIQFPCHTQWRKWWALFCYPSLSPAGHHKALHLSWAQGPASQPLSEQKSKPGWDTRASACSDPRVWPVILRKLPSHSQEKSNSPISWSGKKASHPLQQGRWDQLSLQMRPKEASWHPPRWTPHQWVGWDQESGLWCRLRATGSVLPFGGTLRCLVLTVGVSF